MGSPNGNAGTGAATVNPLSAPGDMGSLFNMGASGGTNGTGGGGGFDTMAKFLLLSLTRKIEDETSQKQSPDTFVPSTYHNSPVCAEWPG